MTELHYFTDNNIQYYFTFIDDIPYLGSNSNDKSAVERSLTGTLSIPSSFTYEGTTYSITHFAQYAFYQVQYKELIFPKTSIKLSGAVCESMPNLEFVDLSRTKIDTIYGFCFSKCLKLKTILLPISLKVIEKDSFEDSTTLTKLFIYESLTTIDSEYSSNHPLKTIYYCGKRSNGLILPSTINRVFVPYYYSEDTFSGIKVTKTITNCMFESTCQQQTRYFSYDLICIFFVFSE